MSTHVESRTKEEIRQRLRELWCETQFEQAKQIAEPADHRSSRFDAANAEASVDIAKARQVWTDYQANHDVTEQIGMVVGIDPITENVWFGNTMIDVVKARNAAGFDSLLFFERVGYRACFTKGGRF